MSDHKEGGDKAAKKDHAEAKKASPWSIGMLIPAVIALTAIAFGFWGQNEAGGMVNLSIGVKALAAAFVLPVLLAIITVLVLRVRSNNKKIAEAEGHH